MILRWGRPPEGILTPTFPTQSEELLRDAPVPCGVRVYDLGSGTGITSVLLAREYGLDSYAVNL